MIREIKIKNKADFPNGQWVKIAHERDEKKVNDDEIYFYVENKINLKSLRIGDKIQLDEEFEIVDIKSISNDNFKIGNLSLETFEVLIHDLELLFPKELKISQKYNYELLKGNLQDIFGFYTQDTFYNPNMNIKEITKEEFDKILDTQIYYGSGDCYYPFGRFWFKTNNLFVGIDNSGGEAWTEEFKSKKELMNWL